MTPRESLSSVTGARILTTPAATAIVVSNAASAHFITTQRNALRPSLIAAPTVVKHTGQHTGDARITKRRKAASK